MANRSIRDAPAEAVKQIGKLAGVLDPRSLLAAPNTIARRLMHVPSRKPGMAPGQKPISSFSPQHKPTYNWMGFVPDRLEEGVAQNGMEVAERCRQPDETFWLDIQGLDDLDALRGFMQAVGVHQLLTDDVFNCLHRPKFEEAPDHDFAILKMIRIDEETGQLTVEQVSFLIFDNLLITFQEKPGDVFEPVRVRLREGKGRIRKLGPSYVAYALMDAIVEHYYLVLEDLAFKLEELERAVLNNPQQHHMHRLQQIREDALLVKRSVWPARELFAAIEKTESAQIVPEARPFFRDVYDHVVQVMDAVDSLRDLLAMVLDLYMSGVSNRMNEVMKTLTIMATIFLPMSFLAGVYGMNFEVIPELQWKYGYAAWWGATVLLSLGMLGFFRRKGWL